MSVKPVNNEMDPKKIKEIFDSMSPNEIKNLNEKQHAIYLAETGKFEKEYPNAHCYLCNKPFKTISKDNPCLHWLLKQCKFKKNDFPKIYKKYGYHQIASFLRACANQERYMSNINDLNDENNQNKILCCTIKWKNISWTFDCKDSDFQGHKGTGADFPHYHFQMRIDKKQFINFNDYHVPFNKDDIFNISLRNEEWLQVNFGRAGAGMQEAMDTLSEQTVEHMVPADEKDATYRIDTIVETTDNPILGTDVDKITNEANLTGKTKSAVIKKLFGNKAKVTTIISPAGTIPDIAERTRLNK